MLYIHGLGHFHPATVISNSFLESLDIGADECWLVERFGILERRTALDLEYIRATRNADIRAAAEATTTQSIDAIECAARNALTSAGASPADIGVILSGSSCSPFLSPATAFILADRLGISPICVDVSSACMTFLMQILIAPQLLSEPEKPFALLVQCEMLTRTVDYSDKITAALMGDAATAAVVSTRARSNVTFSINHLGTDTSAWDAAVIPATGHFSQDGPRIRQLVGRHFGNGFDRGHDDFIIFHQTNLRLLEEAIARLELTSDRHLYNVDRYGNRGSAGLVSVLSENWERLSRDATVFCSAVGAGVSFGSATLSSKLS